MSRFQWRIHGDRTLAYRLDDREVPELFGEEFELGADECVAILHGERGLESLTRATLKTGGGLDWIRKFFCRGEPLSVLFHKAGPAEFVLHFHAPCSDGEPLEGAARVSASVSSMRAALLIPFFGTHSALAVDDLLDPLEKVLSEALVAKAKWEKFETFRTAPPALQKIEEALTPVLRDAMKAMGLGPGKIVWAWATDDEQRGRIHGHLERRAEIAETLEAERAEFSRERPLRILGTHLALLKTAQEMLVAAEPPRDLDLHLRAALGYVRPAEGTEEHARETLDDTLEEEIERVSEDLKQKKILLGVDQGEYLSEAEPKGPARDEGKPPPTPGEAEMPPASPGGEAPEAASPASPAEGDEPEPESESCPEEVPTFELPPLNEALKLGEGAAPSAPEEIAPVEVVSAESASEEASPEDIAPVEAVSVEVVPEEIVSEEVVSAEPLPTEAPPTETILAEAAPPEVPPEAPSPEEASRPESALEAAPSEDEAVPPEPAPGDAARPAEEGAPEPVAEAAREADTPKTFVFSPAEETAGAFEPSVPAPGLSAQEPDEEENLSPQELLARFLERTAGMRFADRPPPEEVQPPKPPETAPAAAAAPAGEAPADGASADIAPESVAPSEEPAPIEPGEPPAEEETPAGAAATEPAVEVVETEPAEAPSEPSAPLPAAAPVPEEAGEGLPSAAPVLEEDESPAPGGREEAGAVEEIEEIEELEPLEEIEEEPAPSATAAAAAAPVAAAAVVSAAAAVGTAAARPQAPLQRPAAAPRPRPEVRARPARVAYEWRLYGEDSLAYRLHDCEMPLLLREDFDVGPAQAALVLRGTQCMEVMTTGAVRSGTGLQWIRRLFGPGADICVLFVITTPIPLVLDLFSLFADAEPVAAEVTLKLRIAPASAAGLISLLDAEGALSGRGLREIFTHSVVLPVVERELSSSVSGGSGGLAFSFLPVENAVREAVKKVAFSWGFLVEDLSFHWGADPAAFREIDDAAWKRAAAEWEMKTRGRLAAAEHASSLLARRTEGLRSLGAALNANAGADMVRFLTRAALGIEALEEGNPPDIDDVRHALEENLAQSQKAMDALAGAREETSRALAEGPPPRPERRTGEESEADDFGFLSEGDDDALDAFAFSFHQPIREAPSAPPPPPPPSAAHAPAFERRSYAPSALSGMGAGGPGTPGGLGDLSAPIGAAGGSVNRCPYCLSAVKPGWASCGNCGRLLPTS